MNKEAERVGAAGEALESPDGKMGPHEFTPAHPESRKVGAKRSCGRNVCRLVTSVGCLRLAVQRMHPSHGARRNLEVGHHFLWSAVQVLDAMLSGVPAAGDLMPRGHQEAWCRPAHCSVGGLSTLDRLPVHQSRLYCALHYVRMEDKVHGPRRFICAVCNAYHPSARCSLPSAHTAGGHGVLHNRHGPERRDSSAGCTGTCFSVNCTLPPSMSFSVL